MLGKICPLFKIFHVFEIIPPSKRLTVKNNSVILELLKESELSFLRFQGSYYRPYRPFETTKTDN